MSQEPMRHAKEMDSLLDDARYWFDQYRFAAGWEARLIREIDALKGDSARTGPEAGRQ
jgi:hypothetical protein